jgi:phytoene dehydrogenase-like protein
MTAAADVIIIGAGHNGLVAATLLARTGLKVLVVEERDVVGGAVRTERPFRHTPELRQSTGAYLLGLMPPELMQRLGLRLKLIRRDPHYFVPTMENRYLLFGSDEAALKEQFIRFFSERDWAAHQHLSTEIGQLRDDLAPTWLQEPLSVEETAQRFVRPALRQVFIDLVRQPVENYLDRFDFEHDLVKAMYAVTDAFSGLSGGPGTPGTGMNFLVHNMCRLPGADGTWMIVAGGMGSVTTDLARLATEAGAEIRLGAPVDAILTERGTATGVRLLSGEELRAHTVVSNADPFRMRTLVGRDQFPTAFNERLDGQARTGMTMKVNLALDRLPQFRCLQENRGQHNGTIHLLPPEEGILEAIKTSFLTAQAGRLADFPTIEWYIHTEADPSLKDAAGHHSSAFFVQWVPYELKGTTWAAEEDRYVRRLIDIADQFAPGFASSVVDTFTLTPPKIEQHFGMPWGHIHHVDNTFGFDQRVPYRTPVDGLYSCSAGTHPAGSVIGAAGHNAAERVLKDLGLAAKG